MINYVVTNSLYVVTNDTWKTIDRSIKMYYLCNDRKTK